MQIYIKASFKSCLVAISMLLAISSAFAYTQTELETFDNEPPIIKDLLERASGLLDKTKLADEKDADAAWRAANLYCEASRYSSAEAVYRLGMLYAFGRGVPQNRDYAANLFGIAAVNGHFEAQKMLDTIEIKTNDTPPCVTDVVAPEHAPAHPLAKAESPAIDAYIASLPKSKRWVVDLVETIADWHKVDSKLVLSIITAESNFKVAAAPNNEAQGLMQLIPELWSALM